MKKNIYNAKIIEIEPSAVESPGHIVDAFVKFQIDKMEVWTFISDWHNYFPYWKEPEKYTSNDYIYNLIGKFWKIELWFLDLNVKLSDKKVKEILPQPDRRKPCDYILRGEVISKEPSVAIPDEANIIEVDFGVIVRMNAEKDKYKIGDHIEVEGILYAYRVENENLNNQ